MKMYLPVYMWTLDCRKRGVNTFWELLKLISACDGEKLAELKTTKVRSQSTQYKQKFRM